jgi:16S rRNA (guanine527-N7)-methyltransferase
LAVPADFVEKARALGVEFDPGDTERLGLYLAMLLQVNAALNLTGITDRAEAWTKHILDAMSLVPVLAELVQNLPEGEEFLNVIDVGTGGGVPGIPLAIVMPQVRVTLLEATGKKADFLEAAIYKLKLPNARVLCDRAERIGQDHKTHREMYDVAIARALGRLNVVAELIVPLVKQGGHALAVKGAKAAEELAEANDVIGMLGARHVQTLDTPTGKIVVLEKASRTPRLYPRKNGEPKRLPLGGVNPKRAGKK